MQHDPKIFSLPIPEIAFCKVWAYRVHFGNMVVQATWGKDHNPRNTIWLQFFNVLFFEGGMRWRGAKFETGTPEQQTEIMHRIGYGDATDKELPSVQLYQIRDASAQGNLYKVRIIANGVAVKFEPFKLGDFDTL